MEYTGSLLALQFKQRELCEVISMKPTNETCKCGYPKSSHAKQGAMFACHSYTPKGKESASGVGVPTKSSSLSTDAPSNPLEREYCECQLCGWEGHDSRECAKLWTICDKCKEGLEGAGAKAALATPNEPQDSQAVKVLTGTLAKPMPSGKFEEWLDREYKENHPKGAYSTWSANLAQFCKEAKEKHHEHCPCRVREEDVAQILKECKEKAEEEVSQAAFERGKMLSKEVHCSKHGWACTRCEVCVNESYLEGQRSKTAYKLGLDEATRGCPLCYRGKPRMCKKHSKEAMKAFDKVIDAEEPSEIDEKKPVIASQYSPTKLSVLRMAEWLETTLREELCKTKASYNARRRSNNNLQRTQYQRKFGKRTTHLPSYLNAAITRIARRAKEAIEHAKRK